MANRAPAPSASPPAGAAAPPRDTPAGTRPRGPVSWFVRRAGLARCTTFAAAAGFTLAALTPGHFIFAVAGLTCALVGMLAGHALGRLRPLSRTALPLLLGSVVLVGLMAGLLIGNLRLSSLLAGELPSRIGETVRAELVITGPVASHSGWQSATAEVVRISAGRSGTASGAGEKLLLEVAPAEGAAKTRAALAQGMRISVRGALAGPDGPSASGYDQEKQLLHQGIRVVLEADPASGISFLGRRGGVSGWFDRMREGAKSHLARGPDARVNEVLQGVVMGDTAGIDEGWMDAFRRSGTAHMLSVSGLHVASLAAIVIALAGLARLSRRAGFILAAGAALLMVPFVGPSPPIIRSAAMMTVVLAGRLVGRRRDQWQGLAFAALVVLAINPFAVFDVGFQLSFSAFAGMIGLVRPIERVLNRVPDAARANLAVSVAATLGTALVSLLVFGRTSLISPVANLLVVPVLGAVTGLGMASVMLGFVWAGFSAALDALASLPMMWAVLVSTACSRVPVLETQYMGVMLLATAGAALALPAALALCGRSVSAPRGLRLPGFARAVAWLRRRRPPDRRWGAALGLLVVLIASGLAAAAYPAAAAAVRSAEYLKAGRNWPASTEVRVLDVGQGSAVLVRTKDHHAALFDAGPKGADLAGQLRALGVKRLDLVVISHPHADHFAGLAEALDAVQVDVFVDRVQVASPEGRGPAGAGEAGAARSGAGYAASGSEAREYLELRARLEQQGCRFALATSGATVPFHGATVRFYAPAKPLVLLKGAEPWGAGRSPPTGDELNAGSIVAALEVGGASVLLPGDAESNALSGYRLPAVNVLVVGHHGSRDAVSTDLLERLRPSLAVVSVGKVNPFGHPDPGTLAILDAARKTVLRTDQSGWVSLAMTDGGIAVSTERTNAP